MLQAANNDLFNPSVPKAHNCVSNIGTISLQIKPVNLSVKASLLIFIFYTLGANRLS